MPKIRLNPENYDPPTKTGIEFASVSLNPGENLVSDEELEAIKKHPLYQHFSDSGLFGVPDEKPEPKPTSAKK